MSAPNRSDGHATGAEDEYPVVPRAPSLLKSGLPALMWTRDEGIALCRLLETIAPKFGAHVALTGGLLYRDGFRKDCDILVYRIRQKEVIDWQGLLGAWSLLGLIPGPDYGWCQKASFEGKPVDLFDPESDGVYGAYGNFEPVLL